jgi:hypothetical protein
VPLAGKRASESLKDSLGSKRKGIDLLVCSLDALREPGAGVDLAAGAALMDGPFNCQRYGEAQKREKAVAFDALLDEARDTGTA